MCFAIHVDGAGPAIRGECEADGEVQLPWHGERRGSRLMEAAGDARQGFMEAVVDARQGFWNDAEAEQAS